MVSTFRTEALQKSPGHSSPVSNQEMFVPVDVAQPRLLRTAALVGMVRSALLRHPLHSHFGTCPQLGRSRGSVLDLSPWSRTWLVCCPGSPAQRTDWFTVGAHQIILQDKTKCPSQVRLPHASHILTQSSEVLPWCFSNFGGPREHLRSQPRQPRSQVL